jgi:Predicted integral membrane protein (DUF2269)
MTSYFALKFLHVLGAAVLLGTGAGIAFFMVMAHRTKDAGTVAGMARTVVLADFLFTATSPRRGSPLAPAWRGAGMARRARPRPPIGGIRHTAAISRGHKRCSCPPKRLNRARLRGPSRCRLSPSQDPR